MKCSFGLSALVASASCAFSFERVALMATRDVSGNAGRLLGKMELENEASVQNPARDRLVRSESLGPAPLTVFNEH
jgi:hypothetical protein